MKKINLAVIANNYGQTYDGVGAFATVINENFSNRIKSEVYTAMCNENDSAIKRITTFGMTKSILKVATEWKAKKFDVVLMDYPFVEWNPLILLAYYKLYQNVHKTKKKIILSLHEYSRVNRLRKLVIKKLVKYADCTLVSNEALKKDVSAFAKQIYIRNIPTNIYGNVGVKSEETRRNFVYFGLVNKAKAFNEMLEAWDQFNADGKYHLYVLSGSKLDNIEEKHKNLHYYYRVNDEMIMEIMAKCLFCIVPVRPEIDMKNATFKTGALAGCICLGKFSQEYKDKSFVINMEKYETKDFVHALKIAEEIDFIQAKELSKEAKAFGELYTPQVVSSSVENYIFSVCEGVTK